MQPQYPLGCDLERKSNRENGFCESVAQDRIPLSIRPLAARRRLLVRYFTLLGGTDAAYALIDQVLAVVRAGSSKETL